MALIVQKFGGTSVADSERIQAAARHALAECRAGHQVVVIVSAMAGTTDQLLQWAHTIAPDIQNDAEYDTVLAAGEQITAGLMALALRTLGQEARSFLAWQLPLHSSHRHQHGTILDIDTRPLTAAIQAGIVPVIAGFQGLHAGSKRLVTLGRGGSDTSAVAVAAALSASRCDIYTDVDGVYSVDPRLVPTAKKLRSITSSEMLEMASLGAKVLHPRSVQLAMQYHVPLQVRSSFTRDTGTYIIPDYDRDPTMEPHDITGLAYTRGESLITLTSTTLALSALMEALVEKHITASGMLQHHATAASVTLQFTVHHTENARALRELEVLRDEGKIHHYTIEPELAKISTIGIGMQHPMEVAQRIVLALAEKEIPLYLISAAEVRVSALIPEIALEKAMRTLHACFGLDAEVRS